MMKKRVLAALMSLIMLLSVLTSAAADAVYTYPQLGVTIKPSDMSEMEREFRVWATNLIRDYAIGEYYALSGGNQLTSMNSYSEYYRLAKTKMKFDGQNVTDKDVIYNTSRDADMAQNDSLYLFVIAESMKEAVLINEKDIMASLNQIPEEKRKFIRLDIEAGAMKIDDVMIITNELANDYIWSDFFNAVTDVVVLAADTVGEIKLFASKPNQKVDMRAILESALESVDAIVTRLMEAADANAKIYARNLAREVLIDDLASQLYQVNGETISFLRNTYQNVETHYGYQHIINQLLDCIDPAKNPQLTVLMANQAVTVVDNTTISDEYGASIKLVDSVGIEFLESIDVGSAVMLGLADAFGEVLKGVMTALSDFIANGLEGKYLKINGMNVIKWSDVSDILLDTISDTVNGAIDKSIDGMFEEYLNGEGVSDAKAVMTRVWNDAWGSLWSADLWRSILNNLGEKLYTVPTNMLGTNKSDDFMIKLFSTAWEVVMAPMADSEDGLVRLGDALYGQQLGKDDMAGFVGEMMEALGGAIEKDVNNTTGGASLDKLFEKAEQTAREEKQYRKAAQYLDTTVGPYNKGWKIVDKAEKTAQEARSNRNWAVISIICNVFDNAWEAGTSIGELLESSVAAANEEGQLSYLASMVTTSYKMSNDVLGSTTGRLRNMGFLNGSVTAEDFDIFLDPNQVPLETVVTLVSLIHSQLKYDIVGTKNYYDIAFQGWVEEAYFGTIFERRKDGSVVRYNQWNTAEFWDYTLDHHVNVYDEMGVVKNQNAAQFYNKTTAFWQNYYVDEWNPDWQIFLN